MLGESFCILLYNDYLYGSTLWLATHINNIWCLRYYYIEVDVKILDTPPTTKYVLTLYYFSYY